MRTGKVQLRRKPGAKVRFKCEAVLVQNSALDVPDGGAVTSHDTS